MPDKIVIHEGAELVGSNMSDIVESYGLEIDDYELGRKCCFHGVYFADLRVGNILYVSGTSEKIEELRKSAGMK